MRLREWKNTEFKALEDNVLLFGEGNTDKIRSLVPFLARDHPAIPFSALCGTKWQLGWAAS